MRYPNVCVCFFVGEMGDQLSTYATVGWMRGHPKWEQLCTGGGDVTPYVCARTYTIVFMFWQHFCFIVSCFPCRNLTLPLFKKDVFVTNCYFSLKRSIFNITK